MVVRSLEEEINSYCATFLLSVIPSIKNDLSNRLAIDNLSSMNYTEQGKCTVKNPPEWEPANLGLKANQLKNVVALGAEHYRDMILWARDLRTYITGFDNEGNIYSHSETKKTLNDLKTELEKGFGQVKKLLELTSDLYIEDRGSLRLDRLKPNFSHLESTQKKILDLLDKPDQAPPPKAPVEEPIGNKYFIRRKEDPSGKIISLDGLSVSFWAMLAKERAVYQKDPKSESVLKSGELTRLFKHLGFEFPVYNPFTDGFRRTKVSLSLLFDLYIPHLEKQFIEIQKQSFKLQDKMGYIIADDLILKFPTADGKPTQGRQYLLPNLGLTIRTACQLLGLRFRREYKDERRHPDSQIVKYYRKLPKYDHMKKGIEAATKMFGDYRRQQGINYEYKP